MDPDRTSGGFAGAGCGGSDRAGRAVVGVATAVVWAMTRAPVDRTNGVDGSLFDVKLDSVGGAASGSFERDE